MTNTELLLGFIGFMLLLIWIYVRWIYLRIEYPGDYLRQPVNQYGESFTDAIQNSIVRGTRGIHTHD